MDSIDLLSTYIQFEEQAQSSKSYTEKNVFEYNYFVWTLAFYIGLQFTHMD